MKKSLLFLFLALSVFSTQAQTRYTASIDYNSTYPPAFNTYGCPVRYWKNDQSVAFVKQSSSISTFCLIKHSDFSNTFPLPAPTPVFYVGSAYIPTPISTPSINDNFTVNDIYIVDDYAFFCGNYIDPLNKPKAFYGYFDINDFSGTSLNLHIHTLDNGPDDAPVTLTKLVAYEDGMSYTIVAIGNEKPEHPYGCCKVVEVPDVIPNPPSCNIADMPIMPPYSGNKLYLDDIILTQSYVVLLGHDICVTSPVSGYPWFAVCNKGSVVTDVCSTMPNNNYYLPMLGEANDAVAGVALGGEVFAMSYVHYENYTNYTRMRTIDCSILQNTYSQQFKKPSKENPVEMIYLKDLKTVELLQWVTDSANFVQLNPFATVNYNTSMLTPDGREYKTLSPINGKRYISACSGVVYLQDRTATLPTTPICPSDMQISVEMMKELPPVNYPLQGSPKTITVNAGIYSAAIIPTFSLTNHCYSFE